METKKLQKKYFCVDIESNGPHPVVSSMLSIGACVVGDRKNTFYAELKPLTPSYDLETFKIGASGLKSLKDYDFSHFDPTEVMSILNKQGEEPEEVMTNFAEWIELNREGKRPIFCAAPVIFDGSFVSNYFFRFLQSNPFGYTGEDMQSMFRGYVHNLAASFKELRLRGAGLNHNALEDALQEEKEWYTVLYGMGQQDRI